MFLFLTADYTDSTDVMNRRKTKETKPLEATGPLFSSLSYVQILWAPANPSISDSGFYMLNRSLIRVNPRNPRLNVDGQ